MKQLKITLSVAALAALAFTSNAQTAKSKRTAYNNSERYYNSYTISKENGKTREHVKTNWNNKVFEFDLLNGNLTALAVEGETVPASQWGKYSDVINAIKVQLKVDREQARRDQAQAIRDRAQAEIDRKQAVVDRVQGDKDRAMAAEDRARAVQDQIQAQRDREQAVRDREQADRDRAQAALDRIQADKDRKQADEDRQQLKALVSDLVSDKLIGQQSDLHNLTLNSKEMTINGNKQPDEVQKKYAEKYARFAMHNLSYGDSGNGNYQRIHMHMN